MSIEPEMVSIITCGGTYLDWLRYQQQEERRLQHLEHEKQVEVLSKAFS
jgi:hypothetical protein